MGTTGFFLGGLSDTLASVTNPIGSLWNLGEASYTVAQRDGDVAGVAYGLGSLIGATQATEAVEGENFLTGQALTGLDRWGMAFQGTSAASGVAAVGVGIAGIDSPLDFSGWFGKTAEESTTPLLNAGTRVGPKFDPVKLQNILSAYERQGGTVITGESAQSILSNIGANAAYHPVEGGPGALIIQPGATRLEVTEELMHLGQFRAAGWPSSSPLANPGLNVQFELDAQDRLLNLAQRQNWSAVEINKILQNQQTWLSVSGKGE